MDVILIATDDRETKESLDVILGTSCVLFQATNIDEVSEILQDNPIDVALVDEILDGRNISEELSSISTVNRYTRVVVLAAEPKSRLARNYLTLGAQDIIRKPPIEEEVISSAQKAFKHVRLRRGIDLLEQAKADEESRLRAMEERFEALFSANLSMARNAGSASLGSFHKALVNIRDARRLYELIVEAFVDVFPIANVALVLKDEDRETFAVRTCKGLNEELVKQLRFDAKEGVALWLRRNGGLLLIEEKGLDASAENLVKIRREAELLRAKVCVPLLSDGRFFGFLSVGRKISGERFGDGELQSMFQLAKYAAGAIENAVSYDEISTQKTNFQRIIQYATSGIAATDAEGRIIAINEKAAALLRISSEQVIEKHAQELGSVFSHIIMQTLQEEKVYSNEKVTNPVSKAPLMVSASLLKNGNGEKVGVVMLLTDISSLPEDTDVGFGELVKMKFLTDILNDTIGNSLVPISTLNQIVKGKHDLDKHVRRAEKEIEDLVNFTKISSDFAELSISTREYDIVQFLSDWVSEKRKETENKHISIELKSGMTNQKAYFDPGRLGQALEEIVKNSIGSFFPDQEDKRIDISSLEHHEKDKLGHADAIEMAITDNGRGIKEEDAEMVFEPFYSKGKGSKRAGLGLSIARKIIELHGGSIEIESREGVGTTVRIILPRNARGSSSRS